MVFDHLNITLALLDPDLMTRNRETYKRIEAAFIRDITDLRAGRLDGD
jgi:hypothetical protein